MDYLQWESLLSAELVFKGSDKIAYPSILADGSIVFLSAVNEPKRRSVLVRLHEGQEQVITPAPFDLQTRVNEYGGKPYWVCGNQIIFANKSDQCLYSQDLSVLLEPSLAQSTKAVNNQADYDSAMPGMDSPVQLSKPQNSLWMYTDVHRLSNDCVLCIAERQDSSDHSANPMALVVIDTTAGEPQTLVDGSDFYSNLVVDLKQGKVAWVQWQHPNMPWDDTQLMIADLALSDATSSAKITNLQEVPLQSLSAGAASVCQLMFSAGGELIFSADFADDLAAGASNTQIKPARNFWNIYQFSLEENKLFELTQEEAEHGYPHWVYGDCRVLQVTDQCIVAIQSRPEYDSLIAIDTKARQVVSRFEFGGTIEHLCTDGAGNVTFIALSKVESSALASISVSSNRLSNYRTIRASKTPTLEVSQARHFSYQCSDGCKAYGFFYPPTNQEFQAKTSEKAKPPLLVMVHGGPTARAYGHFDLQKQFWTNRGFAIFDVNHRGSSGYGRRFRDALYEQWGEIDTKDIIDGIDDLAKRGWIDIDRVCIRGKSAGGYAVLRALTEYPDYFKAGASYYGIGNLVTLAEATHKFEKFYVDRLIGESFSAESSQQQSSNFYTRSPINKIGQLKSAMIVFQGLLDKVVPPTVAQELVGVLQQQQQAFEYVEYEDEAHGFKQLSNNIDAWARELAFYQRILSQSPRPS